MAKRPVVARCEGRYRADLFGLAAHYNRTIPCDGADPSRSHLNRTLVGSGNAEQDVLDAIGDTPLADKRGAVVADLFFSAHKEWFDEICPGWQQGKTNAALEKWIADTMAFINAEHGADNVASAVLHMDEDAVHIHAFVVPKRTYTKKFRRGEKEVTRVHYNHYYSNSKAEIAEARRTGRQADLKLGQFQTRYADAMASHGLVRGDSGTGITHTTVQQFRSAIRKPTKRPKRPKLVHVPDPTIGNALRKTFGGTDSLAAARAKNATRKEAYRKAISQYTVSNESKGKAYDILKKENRELKKRNAEMNDELRRINDELELRKSEIDALRNADLSDVASALTYDGDLHDESGKPKWKGAIDMVMDVGGMSYASAVAWLYHELGVEKAREASVQHSVKLAEDAVAKLDERKPKKPLTKQQFAITQELGKQLDALGASLYRITMMHNDLPTYNEGKGQGPDGSERFWSREEVLQKVPQLNYRCGHDGYNVYITPMDDKAHYVLLDDMSNETYDKLKDDGHSFCVAQHSSHGNVQAVLKIPADDVPRPAVNELFKRMNVEHGDPNISGLTHPFRAAGFRNMKPKHRDPDTGHYPVVTLIEAAARTCRKALDMVREIAHTLRPTAAPAPSPADVQRMHDAIASAGDDVALAPYYRDMARRYYTTLLNRYGADVDMSRADWMVLHRLMDHGATHEEAARAVGRYSPGIAERHKNVARYIATTVANAVEKRDKKSTLEP